MTFEDFLLSHEVTNCGDYNGKEVIEFMRQTWDAAKQYEKEFVYIEHSELVGDWTVRDYEGTVIKDWFMAEEEAEDWALENGYRLK